MASTFGRPFDSTWIEKFKKHNLVFNDYVQDERGFIGWKVTRPSDDGKSNVDILYSEEVVSMMFSYVKMLAEIQAEGQSVRDCVITIPSWFTYDQRLMIKDAAELAELRVLHLVHENTAAAVMYGIDHKIEEGQTKKILFYNMGFMDTEVTIAQYTMLSTGKNKFSPYIEILSEASNPSLGTGDLTISLVKILANKFNNLPERKGKPDVMENTRALGRLNKDATNIIEILSANNFANVKIPELLDYVTL